jgi:hypothetical protein
MADMFVLGGRVSLQRAERFRARRTNGFSSVQSLAGREENRAAAFLQCFFRRKIETSGHFPAFVLGIRQQNGLFGG